MSDPKSVFTGTEVGALIEAFDAKLDLVLEKVVELSDWKPSLMLDLNPLNHV